MYKKFFLLPFLLMAVLTVDAQHAKVFQKEIDEIKSKDSAYRDKKVILFTGSSTIRMWKNLSSAYPGQTVVNHGFGGSTMKDLLYFTNDLVLRYQPTKIFIYEGDNDLNNAESAKQILSSADSVLQLIRKKFPEVPVYFISAKPSKARWHLKENYEAFNNELKQFTATRKNTYFIDLWTPMLDKNGVVLQDIFINDGLHMNARGYEIWQKEIGKFVN
jgi:lysophospholipase L1-like esterase